MSILRKAIGKIIPAGGGVIRTDRELIRAEARIGGTLFGPIPKGHRRDFFCLDEHTWVWYESVVDPINGKTSAITTRYEVRGDKIIKIQDGQPYRYASLDEVRNLAHATNQYVSEIQRQIYSNTATA